MRRRVDRAVAVLKALNWSCWLGQHRWQTWFQFKVCLRCQQIGFRPRG